MFFPLAKNFFQTPLADPRLNFVPCQVADAIRVGFGCTIRRHAKLPLVQIFHAVKRAENPKRFKRGDGVARAAVNVVFVVTAGTRRGEIAFALVSLQNAFDARFTVNLVLESTEFSATSPMIFWLP